MEHRVHLTERQIEELEELAGAELGDVAEAFELALEEELRRAGVEPGLGVPLNFERA